MTDQPPIESPFNAQFSVWSWVLQSILSLISSLAQQSCNPCRWNQNAQHQLRLQLRQSQSHLPRRWYLQQLWALPHPSCYHPASGFIELLTRQLRTGPSASSFAMLFLLGNRIVLAPNKLWSFWKRIAVMLFSFTCAALQLHTTRPELIQCERAGWKIYVGPLVYAE